MTRILQTLAVALFYLAIHSTACDQSQTGPASTATHTGAVSVVPVDSKGPPAYTEPSSTAPATVAAPTTLVTETTKASTDAPLATQAGISPQCKLFHIVVSGDVCQTVADRYNIKLTDLFVPPSSFAA